MKRRKRLVWSTIEMHASLMMGISFDQDGKKRETMDNITVSFVHVVDKSLAATAVMLLYCLYMGSIQFVISLELTMNLYFLDFYACFSCFYRNEIDKGRKWKEK